MNLKTINPFAAAAIMLIWIFFMVYLAFKLGKPYLGVTFPVGLAGIATISIWCFGGFEDD